MSTPNQSSAGIDVVLTQQIKRAGRIDLVIEAMLQIISGADTSLEPQTTHVLPNWKTPMNYLAENYPVVTLRVGNEDMTERIYGRIMSPTQRGHFVTYAWTAHVWAEKAWQLFQDVDQENETIPMVRTAADVADNIVDALTNFVGDSTSGIVYFDRITARESEPERGPQRLTRVIIAGFVLVQRPLGPAVPPKPIVTRENYSGLDVVLSPSFMSITDTRTTLQLNSSGGGAEEIVFYHESPQLMHFRYIVDARNLVFSDNTALDFAIDDDVGGPYYYGVNNEVLGYISYSCGVYSYWIGAFDQLPSQHEIFTVSGSVSSPYFEIDYDGATLTLKDIDGNVLASGASSVFEVGFLSVWIGTGTFTSGSETITFIQIG